MDTTPPPLPKSHSVMLAAIDELLGLQKKAEVIVKKAVTQEETLTDEDKQTLKHYEEGLQKTLDLIAPAAMEVKNNEVILNDLHARTLYVYNWPNYIYPNWLSPPPNGPGGKENRQILFLHNNKTK